MTAPDAEAIAPGLTEVITEVLAAHPGYQLRMTVWHCACGHPLDITDARPDVAQRAHQSAMVANAIGERWACVELPEADEAGGLTRKRWKIAGSTVEAMGDYVLWPDGNGAHNGCRPESAEQFAAALLAAAREAKGQR